MAGREPMFALMRRQAIGMSWAPLDCVPAAVSYTLLGLVMRCRIKNLTKIGWILAELGSVK